jgi:Tol biopolymer transport system component
MILQAGARLGPYEILSLVGSGGMGEVYRARDTRLGRDVAIKILPPTVADNPSRRARFIREAQAISQLNHPHICAVYDVGEQDGVAYLVMEFIDGETLEHRLRLGRVPWTTAVTWTMQVASALDAAHRRGIVHRDLKPANIMLADSGVKLLDFGIAKLLDHSDAANAVADAAPTASLTAERTMVGTLHYMSPEQLEGRTIDARTDLFSLGATLYEMLTARKAFEGSSPASVTAAILTSDPPAVSTLITRESVSPAALDHVIRRALAKDPDERWQTARDFMIELRSLHGGHGQPPSLAAPRRRTATALAVAAVLVIAALGATAYTAWMRSSDAPALPAIEFTIAPPHGSQFTPGFGRLAITRDGRRIAFVAGPEGSAGLLTWQDLDSSTQRVLVGTEGANGIFWSPNGEWIGYLSPAESRLKRVAARGGTPQVIADNVKPSSPAAYWREDDTIVVPFADGLRSINAAGGTFTKLPSGEGGVLPRPLPGGRVMTLVNALQPSSAGLRVEGQGLSEPVLLPVDSNAVYAGGHLVFRRGETLVAQAFDPHAVRFTAPPVPLVENVAYNPGQGRTLFDASDTLLAYRTAPPRQQAWRDRAGKFLGTVGDAARDWNPVVAPDASLRVAVDRFEPRADTFHIWVTDAFGRSIQVSRGQRERFAAWSPDAQWMAFTSLTGDSNELRRGRVSGEGAEEVLFAGGPGRIAPLHYTKDVLIFEHGRPLDLYALPLRDGEPIAGAEAIRLTETPEQNETLARVSPNGRWLAYTVGERAQREVWVMDLPAGKTRRRITPGGGYEPHWRQDGKELYYIAQGGMLTAVPVIDDVTLRLGEPAPRFPVAVADESTGLHHYAAAPDGQRFLVREVTGAPDVITVIVNWTSRIR